MSQDDSDSPGTPPGTPAGTPPGTPTTASASPSTVDMGPLVRKFMSYIPFNQHLGLETLDVEVGVARMRLPFRPEHVGDPLRPALHGGVLAALIDTCGGAAVWTLLKLTERVSTIDMRVDYLRPARPDALMAEARVTRKGRHVAVVSVRVWHSDKPDSLIAEGKAVYSVRDVGKPLSVPA